jgi:nanoRNase/pAp phosphatase (c-di-AMP/oligoRNAs hydrolase)
MPQIDIGRLFEAVTTTGRLLILVHNNPDPDAIASALALQYLLSNKVEVQARIVYRGVIGRAENRALVRYLGHPLYPQAQQDWQGPRSVAVVDAQPGAGNIVLPPGSEVAIVIDHHAWQEATAAARFSDVRPNLGATATILTEYLQIAGLEPTPSLATALFYGIKTNTLGLGRNTSRADAAAYLYLQPRLDADALAEIEHAQVPADYFKSFDRTLRVARIYDGVIVAYIGSLSYPDLTAEMADVLLRLETARWVVCMGVYGQVLHLSVRARSPEGGAERLVQAMVGDDDSAGGQRTVAGGQVPLRGKSPKEVAHQLRRRALAHLQIQPDLPGEPLI